MKIDTWAQTPGFRVLVYPHRQGDELPKTRWENKGKRLSVIFSYQMDRFDLENQPGQIPKFTLQHTQPSQQIESILQFGNKKDLASELLDLSDE